MPVMLVGGGALALAGGPVGWAAFAAGTMIVSGLMARKAEIDGNKDAAAGWMAVGTIASVGYGVASSASTTVAARPVTGGLDSASGIAAENAANAEATKAGIGMSGIEGGGGSSVSMSGGAGVTNASPSVDASWQASNVAVDKRLAEIASNNLKVQAGAGLLQAGVAWQSGEEQAKIKREQIAEERRLSDRQYANTNNLVDLKVQTPTNLPNLMGQARKQGLINATATTLPT